MPSSEEWLERFQHLLEMADEKAKNRQQIVDNITAMKLAGISRHETLMIIAAELMRTGQISYGALYSEYIDEVYGIEAKETT